MGSYTTPGKFYKPASGEEPPTNDWSDEVNLNFDYLAQRGASVKEYGAVGDGSADDGPEIQAAIDAAANTAASLGRGQTVIFPAGQYKTNQTLELKKGVDLVGVGGRVTAFNMAYGAWILGGVNNMTILKHPYASNYAITQEPAAVRNIGFAHASGVTGIVCLRFENMLRFLVRDCAFGHSTATGTDIVAGIQIADSYASTTTITSTVAIGATSIPVANTLDFSDTGGTVKIGTETGITHTGKSTHAGAGNLTGVPASGAGSVTASHSSGETAGYNATGDSNWGVVDACSFRGPLVGIERTGGGRVRITNCVAIMTANATAIKPGTQSWVAGNEIVTSNSGIGIDITGGANMVVGNMIEGGSGQTGNTAIRIRFPSGGASPQGSRNMLVANAINKNDTGIDIGTGCNSNHVISQSYISVAVTNLVDNGTDTVVLDAPSDLGGGGAPTTADYLVGTANGSLSAEIVVGTTPGGELGGTWASPTVDATHSGSTHAAATTTHEAASDPHTGYRLESADHTHASTGLQGGLVNAAVLTGIPGFSRFKTGLFYANGPFAANAAPTLSELRVAPFLVHKTTTFDELAIVVTTGLATSVFRLGIYRDGGNGYPGVLVVDAGTIDCATSGGKSKTLSPTVELTPDLYWIGGVMQTAAATIACATANANAIQIGVTTPSGSSNNNFYTQASVTGTLPDPFTTTVTNASGNTPRIWLRPA